MTRSHRSGRNSRQEAAQQGLNLCCWHCTSPLAPLYTSQQEDIQRCTQCDTVTTLREGIWRSLAPHDAEHYSRFIAEYEAIREAEGRGSSNAEYYLELPHKDLSGHNSDQWKIRAKTFQIMQRRVLVPLSQSSPRPLRILDLGAGNGWLSYRLSQLGHLPTSIDLVINNRDGLGATAHYAPHIAHMFPRVQASLDKLPFASASFDLAIFNASFHYSEDYTRTLREAVRCLRPGGLVVLADSPWYAREKSGDRMIEEKRSRFQATYGFLSDSIPNLEYLTPARLEAMATTCNLKWRTLKPFYGIDWTLRPIKAMLQGKRKPSHFYIHVAEVSA